LCFVLCRYNRLDLPCQLLLRGICDRFLKKDLPVHVRCRCLQAMAEIMAKADATSAAWLVRVCVRAEKDSEPKVNCLWLPLCLSSACGCASPR